GKRPCTESYLRRCASVLVSVMSFTATNSMPDGCIATAARITLRPIRPNPLMPTRTAIALAPGRVPSLLSSDRREFLCKPMQDHVELHYRSGEGLPEESRGWLVGRSEGRPPPEHLMKAAGA